MNMIVILMMSAKMTTLGLLKKKVFWSKVYDLVIFIHEVANKISSREANYFVDVVMWPKFGHSNISTTEVIITTTL